MTRRPRTTRKDLLAFALGFPGAHLDHPWDEDVAKADGKVFVFFGLEDRGDPGMTVKLRESLEQALAGPGTAPSGYGLGKSGWVDVSFRESRVPMAVLRDWVEESYRLVARKGRIAELDERSRRR